jgi:hypothetical protein
MSAEAEGQSGFGFLSARRAQGGHNQYEPGGKQFRVFKVFLSEFLSVRMSETVVMGLQ